MTAHIKAVIFDLDGVITDTAEYHYLAWKKLADEEGLPFTRQDNEQLRGISRRESLLRLLKGKQVSEAEIQAMMTHKNEYYQAMNAQITPGDLLPGVLELFDRLDTAAIPYGVASASRNAPKVVAALGIKKRLSALADGRSVKRQKPAPDLFRYAAARFNCLPHECLVVEDAEAGIEAALVAGMPCLAVGPQERFTALMQRYGVFPRRDNLVGLTIDEIDTFGVVDEAWTLVEAGFEPDCQHHMETVFTLGNGYFASRGTLEESYPGDHALTLGHGIFDDMPVSYTELANLPNWLDMSLRVDGEQFRLDQGEIVHARRHLNLRQGILHRAVRWKSPGGVVLDMTVERFASYPQPHLGGMRVLLTAVNRPCDVQVWMGINGHVANDDLLHWQPLAQGSSDDGIIWLHSRTRHSGIELCSAATVTTSAQSEVHVRQCPGQPRLLVEEHLDTAQTLQVDKLVCYTASRDREEKSRDVVSRALFLLVGRTFALLRSEQGQAWADLWSDCDVVIEGDSEAQLAIRFNLFQLLVAAPQHDDRASIGAKTLSGLGYRGHVFWDTEIFILPFFSYTRPALARNMLGYRYHTLPGARRKAAGNGFSGAQYAWESAVTGDEVTPTWVPGLDGKDLVRVWTGDIQIHISADVAYAIMQYWRVTGDDAFLQDYGAEIILDTARFWEDRAELEDENGQRRYALRDVIGPDEYHDHVDNNAFTNRMAQWHLQTALTVLGWLDNNYPEQADHLREALNLTPAALIHWQDIIDNIILPHDPDTGLIVQFEGFFERAPIDPAVIAATDESMQVVLGIEGANASQVLKQADVLMLLCLFRDEYGEKTWQANWDAYMPITDHRYGSSLGPSFHAWAACEMDRPDEAYRHFMLAALADLRNPRGNANDGIHAASAGGVWQAVVFGFAGLRLGREGPVLKPRLPSHWRKVSFKIVYQGQKRRFDVVNESLE